MKEHKQCYQNKKKKVGKFDEENRTRMQRVWEGDVNEDRHGSGREGKEKGVRR